MNVLVFLAAIVSAVTTPAPAEVVFPTRDVPVAEAAERPEPIILRQCDPRWGRLLLNERTLCRSGCAFFALRRAFEEAGHAYEPADLLALFRQHDVINEADLIDWPKITDALPLVVTRSRQSISAAQIEEHLNNGRFVILELPSPNPRRRSQGGKHWVFAAQVIGDDIIIDDSRDGARISLQERYGDDEVITGHATIDRLPVMS